MRSTVIVRFVGLAIMFAAVPIACGARTQLGVPDDTTPEVDAAVEAGFDARVDVDARRDAREADAPLEALPPIDASKHDVIVPDDCPDAGATLVYLLSSQKELVSFFPPTRTFKLIGRIDCDTGQLPNSMAVDHRGVAYANLVSQFTTRGSLWRVSTSTAACALTSYSDLPPALSRFGMGYVTRDGVDRLYITDTSTASFSAGLFEVDTTTFAVTQIGTYDRPFGGCELTGTGDGRLYAYCPGGREGSNLSEVDPETAHIVASDSLNVGRSVGAWAVAFWGGKFYLFNAPQGRGGTTVTEFDPVTKSETDVVTTTYVIVGAGVSTCAPL